jgi:hypothetical protein
MVERPNGKARAGAVLLHRRESKNVRRPRGKSRYCRKTDVIAYDSGVKDRRGRVLRCVARSRDSSLL